MYVLQLSQLVPLHYQSDFHPDLADHIGGSVTIWEPSAPDKLPARHCPSGGFTPRREARQIIRVVSH